MHAGLNLPGRHEFSRGGREAAAAANDLMRLGDLPACAPADAAIVYDYEAHWVAGIQPHGADFRYPELVFRWYEDIRRLGLDVDFVPPGASLDRYRLVLAPSLPIVSAAAEAAFAAATGVVVFGPRSGSKTRQFSVPKELPPGPLQRLLRLRVIEVSSLRPGVKIEFHGAVSGHAERWRELVETTADTVATFADGAPALGPGVDKPLGPHRADAGHLAQTIGLNLDLAERSNELLRVSGADATDHPRAEVLLDPPIDVGAEFFKNRARNCCPCVRSLTHSPEAVIHSPAEITAAWPLTVTRSRWPRARVRRTQKSVLFIVKGDALHQAGQHFLR
jgi:Beta-galactosidase trimerisation domain